MRGHREPDPGELDFEATCLQEIPVDAGRMFDQAKGNGAAERVAVSRRADFADGLAIAKDKLAAP
ncbi:hypothetical protein D9M68_942370 [compost metagenome]